MMMYIVATDQDWSKPLEDKDKAVKLMENWKDSYMSEGVSVDESFVELRESDASDLPDFENARVLHRFEVIEDEQQLIELGSPKSNGMDFAFWAKWHEVEVASDPATQNDPSSVKTLPVNREEIIIEAMKRAGDVIGADPAYFGKEGDEEIDRQLRKMGYSLDELRISQ